MKNFPIRRADSGEQKELEQLQLRAFLTNAGDRDAPVGVIENQNVMRST